MANTTNNTQTKLGTIGRKRLGRPPGTQTQTRQARRTQYGRQSAQTVQMVTLPRGSAILINTA